MATKQFRSGLPARMHRQSVIALLARLGYATRGIVYILVGGLAVLASLGPWGTTTDSRGALLVVMEQPLGWIWLVFIGAGLGLFALWRFAQSILDADGLGTSLTMIGQRAAYLISAIGNAGLAAFAVGIAFGLAARSTGGESSIQAWAAWLLQHPYGTWAAIALGLGIAAPHVL